MIGPPEVPPFLLSCPQHCSVRKNIRVEKAESVDRRENDLAEEIIG